VHQRGFPHIGISYKRHAYNIGATFPLRSTLLFDLLEPVFQYADLVADIPAVGLYLLFTRATTRSCSPALAFKVSPKPGQAWQQVLVSGQFNLGPGLGCLSTGKENVEDQKASVVYPYLALLAVFWI